MCPAGACLLRASFHFLPDKRTAGARHHWQMVLLFLVLLHAILFPMLATGVILPSNVALQRMAPEESARLAQECGHSTEKLPGGREHPWAVSFMTKGRNKLGGTIISPYHIITVAHGFIRFDNSGAGPCEVFGYRRFESIRFDWTVAMGSDCIRAQPDDPVCAHANITHNRIRAIFIDDEFAAGGCVKGHDWAIVELEEPIHFAAGVQPICLPMKGRQQIPEGQLLTVTSWGRRDAFHKGDILIREIPLRHDAECKGRPWADNMPTQVFDYLCAKALNPRDFHTLRTCHGDSGSGMEWRRPNPIGRSLRQIAGEGKGNNSHRMQAARQVMHSPLVIPELEFMHKWPIINVVKAAKSHPTGSPIAAPTESAIGNETFHILDSIKEGNETLPLPSKKRESSQETVRHQCEMVGITSYGSRQCASDELARFTRVSIYLEKICALTGICYPLEGSS